MCFYSCLHTYVYISHAQNNVVARLKILEIIKDITALVDECMEQDEINKQKAMPEDDNTAH